jgi:1-aminocyclopropane-1-carboxylate deaminase/D-cysteine desulfhydrase-like pyridoxal-dependent ACC family enzyme
MLDLTHDILTNLPRVRLASLPTPLEAAPRLAQAAGLATLHIKREDLAGYALGGNKLRQIDFILAAALQRGADTLVTTASSQSNFCRSLAGACAKIGLRCHLLLRTAGGAALQGNLLLDDIFAADITWTDATDPWDPAIRADLNAIADRVRAAGHTPYVVQLPGQEAPLAAAGWVSGAGELVAQFNTLDAPPDALVVACGSGLTAAGLALGLKHSGSKTRVIGVSVQQPAIRLMPWVIDVAERCGKLIGVPTRLAPGDLTITDDQVPPGYGQASAASIAAVRLAGRLEGLVLDPVYTGKALAGLLAAVQTGALPSQARAVFLHSGGTPGLFHHATDFAT